MARSSLMVTVVLAVVALVPTTAKSLQLTAAQYYSMPRLFELDPHEPCLAVGGVYCLGSFLLQPHHDQAVPLFDMMQEFSTGRHNFNHTVIHRGYCVSDRCSILKSSSDPERFEACVSKDMTDQYGLRAKLLKLDYCERASDPPEPFDTVDHIFNGAVLIILLMNSIGTACDLLRKDSGKPNKYLLAWSMRENWNRLYADYDSGDPRLTALKSVLGIRAFTLALVMLAHSMIVHHMAYIYNPEDIEQGNSHWLSTIFHNGSVVVQGFFMLSSFLFAYNLLLVADDNNLKLSLKMLPQCFLHRVIRILPLHLFTVGLTASWWWRSSSGAQWSLVRSHADACRNHWWTHALHINNIVQGQGDDKCLIQTWFLAADLQLVVPVAAVTLSLARSRRALSTITTLFVTSILVNFAIAYHFDLKPIMMVMNPEVIRSQYAGVPSFRWLYAAPWGSLPAALLGVLLAFLQRHIQRNAIKPEDSRVFRVAYPLFLPALVLWVLGGQLVSPARSPRPRAVAAATYAALDRVGYALIGAVGLIGFFNGVDSVWKRLFEWRGWRPLGRASLGALLLHWNYNLTHLALRSQLSRVAVYEIGGHWHSVQLMTYVTAIPLHILVELPAQRFLQAVFFGNVPRLRQKTL